MRLTLRGQRTLAQPVSCSGMGLHSGLLVNLTLRPLGPSSGVVFRRTDLPGAPSLPASVRHVASTHFATTLEGGGIRVGTVEHLLAALAGTGVDNVLVEVDAAEVPILDGSALPFLAMVHSAGVVEQDAVRTHLRILSPVELRREGRAAGLYPAAGMRITCRMAFDHPLIGEQRRSYLHQEREFSLEIGPARTFGLRRDVEQLLRHGMARGGTLDNAVVLDETGVLNEGGLRFSDEFVRHKILDCLGDLALLGHPILGHFVGVRSGHQLHAELMRELLDRPDAWELLTERECELDVPEPAVPGILVTADPAA